jgi:L-threonine kinase
MNYSVKLFSRIGELLQGMLPDQSHFLVSGIPSRHFFSEAVLQDDPEGKGIQLPEKTMNALRFMLGTYSSSLSNITAEQLLNALLPGKTIQLSSNIPQGKGLSSSSTDILSVLHVVNDYLNIPFELHELYAMAAAIEPTDPCLSETIVVFKQRTGDIHRIVPLPPLSIVYFDSEPAKRVNTLQLKREYGKEAADFFASLLNSFMLAAEQDDYITLFDCITQSSVHNQSIVAINSFEQYRQLAEQLQTGLMVAHSGTVIGFVTRPDQLHTVLPAIEQVVNYRQPIKVYTETWQPY